jgi:hypothetical protein
MRTTYAAAAVVLSLTAAPAMAFSVGTCFGVPMKWPTNNVTFRPSDVSFPAGYWRGGLNRTIDLFNHNPTPFWFALSSDVNGLGLGNGENEVWGSTDPAILGGAPAIAYWWDTCISIFGTVIAERDESDVIFDYGSPFQWTADELKSSLIMYTGTQRQLQSTGIHEFGHASGLLHVNSEYNIMGADFQHIWVNGSSANGYLGEDASDGEVFLYGLWGVNFQDLSVAHWKYSFANGQYSWHAKTGMYNSSGTLLAGADINGEAGYKVRPGQSVRAEFTFENSGESTQVVNVAYYLSTNDVISTGDRLLATTSMSLGRSDVLTYQHPLTIPRDAVRGKKYWIGAIVNYDNAVGESKTSNNATYIPVRVRK